ncbi:MAG TPA: heme exporter protein CcmD [Allosphingosinicella sp.]|nr:heme exporter protein CcmD [Allosphingosinicella sp.]
MNRWVFVIAAYAIALVATLVLVGWSYAAMRRAERDAEALRTRQ